MTPGPTRMPERVRRAGARPMIHHRTAEFSRELAEALELLAPVYGTRGVPLPVHTTGRGALEATICNLFAAGDEIVVCCNGKFGELWATLAESYGVVVHRVAAAWGADVAPAELDALLDEHAAVRAVAVAYADTSTAVANDVPSLARVARAHGALVLVDAVAALGGMPFAFDEWEVDVAVTASQKCLMSSPGLAWVAMSDRAWQASSRARLPRNYWNFAGIHRAVSRPRPETPGTPPVQVVLQNAEALRVIHEEGLENVYTRHDAMARRVRNALPALGLAPHFPNVARSAATVSAIALPGLAPAAVREALRARGVLTAAGLGACAASGFRIGHMGDIR
ncbi:MAG: pyridoxal-phosphate-dependent aminotransferase family protein, partial [Gemmatimonadaceae bacterium]